MSEQTEPIVMAGVGIAFFLVLMFVSWLQGGEFGQL